VIRTAAQILAVAGENNPRIPGPKPRDERILTAIRAARMLGVSAVTLTQMNRNGLIPRIRIGSAYYYRLADVRAYMERAS
jgi:excisionase family DNA binding protein